MSSIAPVSATPPSIPLNPVKPADTDKPGVAAAAAAPVGGDGDGDSDDKTKVSAAKPPGVGTVVDIKA